MEGTWASGEAGAFLSLASEGISEPTSLPNTESPQRYLGSQNGTSGSCRRLTGTGMSEHQSSPGGGSHSLLLGLSRHRSWNHEVRSQVGTGEGKLLSPC